VHLSRPSRACAATRIKVEARSTEGKGRAARTPYADQQFQSA